MRAMILAAGRGERLRPLTDTTPKALVEVSGEALLERHLRNLAKLGIRQAVINLDWLGEMIVERIGDGRRYGVRVTYSPETGNVLETAGGIQRALPMLGTDPFCVVNADIFIDALPDFTDIELAGGDLGHLFLVEVPEFRTAGDFELHTGRVRNGPPRDSTYSGMAVYRPELFAGLEPGRAPLAPLLREAADAGRLAGSRFEGAWEDVGTPDRLVGVRERYGDQSTSS